MPTNSAAQRISLKEIPFMSLSEYRSLPAGSVMFFDVECYANFFSVAFKSAINRKFIVLELSPRSVMNLDLLGEVLFKFCLVGFNSINYDLPMIYKALQGTTNTELKEASDFIIKENNRYFNFEKHYKIKIPKLNHIDLIEVAPLEGSLKLYAGRLHCPIMQDLPYTEDTVLTEEMANIVIPYNCVDLNNTELLFNELAPGIDLRIKMSNKFLIDLRSKSDAQIAEAVLCNELKKVLGEYPQKPRVDFSKPLKYSVPDFLDFKTPQLQKALDTIRNAEFYLGDNGKPIEPPELHEYLVRIGKTVYKIGLGGLHSQESEIGIKADENTIIADNDVTSFYPNIILNQRLYPEHLGTAFLDVYGGIVATRLEAKGKAARAKKQGDMKTAEAEKLIADSLKITINGSFGKLGNKYSRLFAPQLMLQVTLTGQLVLLMLIEMLESIGIDVISGNTDGIVCHYKKERHNNVRAMIKLWEEKTNFETEETQYDAIYIRDVNNYVAVKKGPGYEKSRFTDEQLNCKAKGTFCERGSTLNSVLSKNPECNIVNDAVLHYVKNGTPVDQTIKSCTDVRRFVTVRNVKGGGKKDGVYLGKTVRFYYPKNENGCITYKTPNKKGTFNIVSKTEGAAPLMDLPETLPTNINYDWYIKEAIKKLQSCGAIKRAKQSNLFF